MRKALLIILLLLSFDFMAQDARIEAGLMYNFAINTEWPVNKTTGDFVIVIVGKAKVESFLKTLAKTKKINNRPIVIKKVNAISEIKNCHILFFSKSMKAILPEAITYAKKNKVMLITEGFGRTKKGAGISFTITSGTSDFTLKTSYDINPDALAKYGLKANNKLLNLGTISK